MVFSSLSKPASSTTAALLSLLLLDGVDGQVPAYANSTQGLTGFPPCDALISANLSHAVVLPDSPKFETLLEDYYALATRRAPWCWVLPSTPVEVSQVVNVLRSAGDGAGEWAIAIRSGGHMSGQSNNIAQGVTIDLSHLNTTSYDEASKVASYQPGTRWFNVYSELAKHDVVVAGGREGPVGVAGFTLGGGISWYSARLGFVADQVVNYEVVLANGSIVNANSSSNPDLWKALKGASSNFGIVTRFDVNAVPAANLTVENRAISSQYADDLFKATTDFAALDKSWANNAMITVINYNSQAPGDGITFSVTEVNTANELNTTAFDALNKIPTLQPSKKGSFTLVDAVNATALPPAQLSTGLTYTIAADPRVMRYIFDQHADLVASLKQSVGPKNFSTIVDFQPMQKYVADIGAQNGGNMLGFTNACNKLVSVMEVTLLGDDGEKQRPAVFQQLAAAVQRIKAYAKSVGSSEDFTYLNYADPSQNPIGSYGAENVKFIKDVATRYDQDGFFQRRVPGGFKIDRVV